MTKETVLSCIQPSGDLHLGNYFGAIAHWVQLQDKFDCTYGIVDLHAMTMAFQPEQLATQSRQMLIDLLACGLDFDKSTIFLQSLIPEHTYLFWILNCVCSYGELTRQTQFKDKTDQIESPDHDTFISSGLFTYPVLQAADILIYNAHYVPVGKDQEQHLELSRSIARRFNHLFGQFFNEPKVLSTPSSKVFSPADPEKKMSKSLGGKHYIGLFEEPESIKSKIMAAVTDSGAGTRMDDSISPGVSNLINLLIACDNQEVAEEFRLQYSIGTIKYSNLKEQVIKALTDLTTPFREARLELQRQEDTLWERLHEESRHARRKAQETLSAVKSLLQLN